MSYELSNHLGNVLSVISDKKIGLPLNDTTVAYYVAEVLSQNDYYPGGMMMPGRKFNAVSLYRYGFNGKELDKDMDGNNYDYGFRIYNPQIAKFLSVDPLAKNYPMLTPYQFSSNSPIANVDIDGREKVVAIISKDSKGKTTLDFITNREAVIDIWKSFSGANSIGNKKIVWEEGVGAYGQTSPGGKDRYKYYANGYNSDMSNGGQQFYPDAIDGAGILTIDMRGENAIMKYFDWELDYSKKVEAAENRTNAEVEKQLNLALDLASLAIGVGEFKIAETFLEKGIVLLNAIGTADDVANDVTDYHNKLLSKETVEIIERIKGGLALYNVSKVPSNLKNSKSTADKTKKIFSGIMDTKTALKQLTEEAKKLKESNIKKEGAKD
jgi:RHS repeat-associated protein